MDPCEKDVITACGLYLLAEKKKPKMLDSYSVSSKRRGRRISQSVWSLKDDTHKFFKYFRMSFSKFENLKHLLHTDIEKKNIQFLRQLLPSLK